ncbi:MAG TPA: hypothetical protein VD997_08030 [Phycisphaerales bacterium]|nr:hypothetical protein [Phycisphaerales bacterium]
MEKNYQGEGQASQSRGTEAGGGGMGGNMGGGGGGGGGAGGGGGGNGGGRGRGNAANLSHEARVKGGQRSAQVQVRDEHGQFAGRADKNRSRDNQGGGQSNNQSSGGENTPGRG